MIDNINYKTHPQYQTAEIDRNQSETLKGDIIIPNSIKYCGSNFEVTKIHEDAFKDSQINSITFDPESKITEIPFESFHFSSIEKITLSPQITIIKGGAFSSCRRLKEIEIPPNSELKQIDYHALYNTQIESLLIPSKLTKFSQNWNSSIEKLSKITVMPGNLSYIDVDHHQYLLGKSCPEKKVFDVLIMTSRLIKSANIPDTIEIIEKNAFEYCKKLETFILPPNVKRINSSAFSFCKSLKKFIVPSNSKLQFFEEEILRSCPIKSLVIPQHVLFFSNRALLYLYELKIILIDENTELYHIDALMFFGLSDVILMVPSNKIERVIF